MSIIKLGPDNFERFTVIARPRRYFSFSSLTGVTGSVPVFPRLSTIEKEVVSASFGITAFSETTTLSKYGEFRRAVILGDAFGVEAVEPTFAAYTSSFTTNANRSKKMEVARFVPPFTFDSVSPLVVDPSVLKKSAIQNNLFRFYRPKNAYADWSFTNYQCLNFFSSSDETANSSSLMYPHGAFNDYATNSDFPSTMNSQFSIDFQINPRYRPEAGEEYKAGTIIHVSSSFVLSIITGSHKDESGRNDKFRLQLQLGDDASYLTPSTAAGPRVFKSDDNSLSYNCWHHVAFRWSLPGSGPYLGGSVGYGSFVVDGIEVGSFAVDDVRLSVPNESVVLGNFYEGSYNRNLVENYSDDYPGTFSHPLRSEIHDVKIWNKYLTDSEIKNYQSNSIGPTIPEYLAFYVPVLFTSQSYHKVMGSYPEILKDLGTSESDLNKDFVTQRAGSSPYNSLLHFNTGEIEVNVENYVRDFVTGVYPRLYNLTGSANSVAGKSLYNQPKFKKRNLTILPCDNGKLQMDYGILVSGTLEQRPPTTGSAHWRFVNDFGALDLSLVSLRDVIPTASLPIATEPATYAAPHAGVAIPGRYSRTGDNSSDAVVIFDSSNLFYGSRIHPGSLTLVDPDLTGSNGKIGITLKDNGFGGLYRADALTPHATWAGVGTVLYDEGITVIKSPMLAQFGTSSFSMEMRGERPVHVMQIAVPCPASQVNSSSNPSFQPLTASDDPSETSVGPVIITGINFHDDNLNVVARSQLAQPIVKRSEDRFLFRTKIDW